MSPSERLGQFARRWPHRHENFFSRPFLTRRQLLGLAGSGLTMSLLEPGPVFAQSAAPVATQNKAKNVIFILLTGAPSHTDTFDLKVLDGVTPAAAMQPAMINGVNWPTGILPKLANQLPKMAIVRSMRAWALVHSLAQTWTQIGRNPAAALGDIAPNIGSVVAAEKEKERRPGQVLPAFIGLNAASAIGPGYFPAQYAPFKVTPSTRGLANTTNADGAGRMAGRWSLLATLDGALRADSPLGRAPSDFGNFVESAKNLMYNPVVDKTFQVTAAESALYGNTGFGNSCLVAQKVLAADQGTRFIQITLGGWDMHSNIYGDAQLPRMSKMLDDGVSQLLDDLAKSGMLSQTLVVMAGEFGRTVGPLSAAQGRDHYVQQFAAFAGAGIKGGRALGSTDATGSRTVDPGWSRQRDVRPEDVEATIYSALGIDWTTIRYDDPFGRGFEYVPYAKDDIYGPINELWS